MAHKLMYNSSNAVDYDEKHKRRPLALLMCTVLEEQVCPQSNFELYATI